MPKKDSIFKRIKIISLQNPVMAAAITWVTLMPALGSLVAIPLVYQYSHLLGTLSTNAIFWVVFTVFGAILMGTALLPTTLLSILSGFLLGWPAFFFLVVAYSLASFLGYFIGRKLSSGSLEVLMENYPKAAHLLASRQNKMGQLIFFIRISPVIPFSLSNFLFALLRAGGHKVVFYGLWGMLPRTFLAFCTGLLAESMVVALESNAGWLESITLLGLLLLSFWGIFRFLKQSKVSTAA